jgi:poly-beta-hydroxybutyrate-responsive repressor
MTPPGVTARSTTPSTRSEGLVLRPGSEPRNFLQSCVLLLLRERPDHGYELFERLKPFGIAGGTPGNLYRRLRSLERAGMVRSRWEPSEAGPKRRTYHLTGRGEALLRARADSLVETRRVLDYYLGRHAKTAAPSASAGREPTGTPRAHPRSPR